MGESVTRKLSIHLPVSLWILCRNCSCWCDTHYFKYQGLILSYCYNQIGLSPMFLFSTYNGFFLGLIIPCKYLYADFMSLLLFSARRGRIYLPQDELAQAGISDTDIYAGKVTEKWRSFMKNQIKRARMFFDEAEKGVAELSEASRWPVSHKSLCYITHTGSQRFDVPFGILSTLPH